jgi:hypothetical protein
VLRVLLFGPGGIPGGSGRWIGTRSVSGRIEGVGSSGGRAASRASVSASHGTNLAASCALSWVSRRPSFTPPPPSSRLLFCCPPRRSWSSASCAALSSSVRGRAGSWCRGCLGA